MTRRSWPHATRRVLLLRSLHTRLQGCRNTNTSVSEDAFFIIREAHGAHVIVRSSKCPCRHGCAPGHPSRPSSCLSLVWGRALSPACFPMRDLAGCSLMGCCWSQPLGPVGSSLDKGTLPPPPPGGRPPRWPGGCTRSVGVVGQWRCVDPCRAGLPAQTGILLCWGPPTVLPSGVLLCLSVLRVASVCVVPRSALVPVAPQYSVCSTCVFLNFSRVG